MPGFCAVPLPVESSCASAWSNMPARLQLPPPESDEIAWCGISVELALWPRLGNEACEPSLEVENALDIQGEPELLQFTLDLRHGLAPYHYLPALYDLPCIHTRIHQLDGYAGGLLTVVHGPERCLLAAVLRHLSVVDPQRPEPRYLKQAGLEYGAPINQA